MKKKTKVILSSVMTTAMCASLIAGSTFALFSSRSDVNIAITSGTVKVEASVDEDTIKGFYAKPGSSSTDYSEEQNTEPNKVGLSGSYEYSAGELALSNIAPGDGVKFDLNIANSSNISIKYRVELNIPETWEKEGEEKSQGKLAEVLEVSFDGGETNKVIGNSTVIAQPWSNTIKADEKIDTVHVKIKLPISVGNDYQNQSCMIRVGVYAVQSNAHVTDSTEGRTSIYNAVDLYRFAAAVNEGENFDGEVVELADDIYLGKSAASSVSKVAYFVADVAPCASITDADWTPIGTETNDAIFKGTFEGNGHTIYGLTATGTNAALFGVTENAEIRNVTISGAKIEAEEGGKAGVLVGKAKGTLEVTNVKVENSTVKAAKDATSTTLGALVGSSEGSVTVENVDVQMNESDSELGGQNELVGEGTVTYPENSETTVEFDLSDGFAEKITNPGAEETKWYEVSTSKGLRYFAETVNDGTSYQNYTVKLVANVNLGSEPWTPIGNAKAPFEGTFDGAKKTDEDGSVSAVYTISNLTIDTDDKSEYKWGFISLLKGTVQNVAFEDVSIFAQNARGVAAVAAKCENATIFNVKVHVKDGKSIEGYQWVGGLVGHATSLKATGNEISGSIQYLNYKAGGLVGLICNQNNVFENNTLYDLTISANGGYDYMGGLIGGTSGANGGVHMKNNTFENVTLDGSQSAYTKGGDIGALMGNVGDGPYYSDGNSGTVKVIAKSTTMIHHQGLWGRDKADLSNSSNPDLVVIWNGLPYSFQEEAWTVSNADEMMALAELANSGTSFMNQTIKVMDDISLAGVIWPSPSFNNFRVTIDGNDKTISDVTCATDENGTWRAGLFGHLSGTVKNLTLKNVTAKGAQAGALYGHTDGITLNNVTVSGNINVIYDAQNKEAYPGVGVIGGINADNSIPEGGSVKVATDCIAKVSTKDFDLHKDTSYDSKYSATKQLVLGFTRNDLEKLNSYIDIEEGAQITAGVATVKDNAYASISAAFAALQGEEESLTLTLLDDASYEGYARSGKGLFTIDVKNATIDLNQHTLTLTETNAYDSTYGVSVGASVDSVEIKNGNIVYVKSPKEDGSYSINQFLYWVADGTKECSLTFDNVQLDGNALNAKNADGMDSSSATMTVTIKNECKLVGDGLSFDIGAGVKFDATDSELGKMTTHTASGAISIILTSCKFAGSEISNSDSDSGENIRGTSTTFKATDTTITGDIHFSGSVIAEITGGSIEGTLVVGKKSGTAGRAKVTVTGTTLGEIDKREADLTIDGEPYQAE